MEKNKQQSPNLRMQAESYKKFIFVIHVIIDSHYNVTIISYQYFL